MYERVAFSHVWKVFCPVASYTEQSIQLGYSIIFGGTELRNKVFSKCKQLNKYKSLWSVTRLKYEKFYLAKHLFVIVCGLAPHNFPFCVQKYPQCLGKKSVDDCSWIFFGVEVIFIFKYFTAPQKQSREFLFSFEKVSVKHRCQSQEQGSINLLSPIQQLFFNAYL